ncbi:MULTISPECIES: deoxyguanosinetriphosphate triphosphohydrolase [Phocaeicola]|jgi:dGTPase|uniref:Deoxyguanosinetriphosphate triphosphohydrolase n=1 Tax=Phocaeicola vulgatus TaxID=821 RepID=A0A3E4JGN7_PHOVU|nr:MULTISPECIES: deoxyguanosinetriphosphate triphosphohydrolase [Phocaeicola]MCG0164023.1 deoxyguanosinetriphosphate triphosphohydrolase [Phocaeicola vulgatus]MCG0227559.1 deoxyguanosinetriphosphate triphosphohydrolase [Phocaeicola vulgatus]MCG0363345.1 deoxyguanosinetriphosphate triphosphohydrolase [Phocaeicola vulgatus]RGJ82156.1 deoxyguanosinetriphosphate triphosphohydrolase [Phocaeicola vulgatus]RHJ73842.1 deoxyguanosinetriphosphate triphosphohydrolase [Phocaeicola vulgatus]
MNWKQLISNKRFGMEELHEARKDDRTEFQRDYDRLIFSAPFRRLQNKTQVFPLPGSVFVHNRLTHSLEVSCVGRSLGNDVASQLLKKHPALADSHISEIGSIVSAACLAHDLGNPPFGHSGEKAISTYFSEGQGMALKKELSPMEWDDLTHFEGNANAFRILTHQFEGRRKGGFVMTYSTLASIVKYPFSSQLAGKKSKFGFFLSEEADYQKIAGELGIIRLSKPDEPLRYARHPLVYLVEAADDICYQMMDIEDAHKLKLLTHDETKGLYMQFFDEKRRKRIEEVCRIVTDINEQIAYLRSSVIGALIKECTRVFTENEEKILTGEFEGTLIMHICSPLKEAYDNCSAIAFQRIYRSSDVLDIELAGFRVISTLIDLMINAVRSPEKAYSQLLINRISGQYNVNAPTLYGKIQAVLDYTSGMTDVYALDLYRKIKGNSLPAV